MLVFEKDSGSMVIGMVWVGCILGDELRVSRR